MNIFADAVAIQQNIALIKSRITAACERSGRNIDDVQLMLATKTVPAEVIKLATGLGESLIGENKVQELRDKDPLLKESGVKRHFIGHLQTNKVKDVLKYADCIQSVDRLSLAEELDKHLKKQGREMDIMVQVNTSFESSKFGLPPEDAIEFITALKQYSSLNIKGLMTIGLFSADAEQVRPSFTSLRLIREQILQNGILRSDQFHHLSMGMSGDLETAIEEGATMVRVGTAIFGQRIYPDSFYWNENK